ncbi:tyrosine-type recombinase/integrase [Neolewinella litorea]|nr:tyrosine-type recombinase/integrase [Neolewinella litorea]
MGNMVLIQKVVGRTGTRYVFRPKGYIENFPAACGHIAGVRYHMEQRYWSAPAVAATLRGLSDAVGRDRLEWTYTLVEAPDRAKRRGEGGSEGETRTLPARWQERLLRTEEALRVQRYSWRTVKGYMAHLRGFFRACANLEPGDVTTETVKQYILRRSGAGGYSSSSQHQLLNSLKFWMEHIEGREKTFIELRPRKEHKLPQVLSTQEVSRLFAAVENPKHRCILKVIYGGGLRLGEVCRLRLADIHVDRLQIYIRSGKGNKDRYTTLPQSLIAELNRYVEAYQPDYWLFEGQHGGQYSPRSVQAILKRAVKRSGVNPHATVHTLRHSYATHLLEQGTSLRHIQELLGHNSSRTTEIYTHISSKERQRIISPLDRLTDGGGGEENP